MDIAPILSFIANLRQKASSDSLTTAERAEAASLTRAVSELDKAIDDAGKAAASSLPTAAAAAEGAAEPTAPTLSTASRQASPRPQITSTTRLGLEAGARASLVAAGAIGGAEGRASGEASFAASPAATAAWPEDDGGLAERATAASHEMRRMIGEEKAARTAKAASTIGSVAYASVLGELAGMIRTDASEEGIFDELSEAAAAWICAQTEED